MAAYTRRDLEEFYDEYVSWALWGSSDDRGLGGGGPPLSDRYTADDIVRSAEDKMVADCKRFLDRAWPFLERAPERIDDVPKLAVAARDFWFIRNGRDDRFSRGWPKAVGAALTTLSRTFGETSLYVGRGQRLYLTR